MLGRGRQAYAGTLVKLNAEACSQQSYRGVMYTRETHGRRQHNIV